MRIDIFTLFPDMFVGPLSESIIKRAEQKKIVSINIHNLRDYATDKHQVADDYPYGGGSGMIMKPELIFRGVESILEQFPCTPKEREIILLTPQGNVFEQQQAKQMSIRKHLIFIAGHYKGIDERVRENLVTMELSIGDYVLTGGELPAMVISDAIIRLIPGTLSNRESAEGDSFYDDLLDAPYYTRPPEYKGLKVPDVLLSGNHENIRKWRLTESIKRTYERRPDLLKLASLTDEQKKILNEILEEIEE